MDEFTITFARSARRELENLPVVILKRLFPKIEGLGNEPRPRGCRKLQGETNVWRIRVGDYCSALSSSRLSLDRLVGGGVQLSRPGLRKVGEAIIN